MNTNTDLISREAALEKMGKLPLCWEYGQAVAECWGIVNDLPAVDAVPVVRCKDCEWWGLPKGMYATENVKHCEFGRYMVGSNGYCVYGEVKDNESE